MVQWSGSKRGKAWKKQSHILRKTKSLIRGAQRGRKHSLWHSLMSCGHQRPRAESWLWGERSGQESRLERLPSFFWCQSDQTDIFITMPFSQTHSSGIGNTCLTKLGDGRGPWGGKLPLHLSQVTDERNPVNNLMPQRVGAKSAGRSLSHTPAGTEVVLFRGFFQVSISLQLLKLMYFLNFCLTDIKASPSTTPLS